MAVCLLYIVKSDLSSVHYCTRGHWTSNFLQGTRKKIRGSHTIAFMDEDNILDQVYEKLYGLCGLYGLYGLYGL